jgi:DNA-binding CsgD family transcriptional regulator
MASNAMPMICLPDDVAAAAVGALQPYLPMVKANVPTIHFETQREMIAGVRGELGEEFERISAGVPAGWAWLHEHARALATEMCDDTRPAARNAPSPGAVDAPRRRGRPTQTSLSDRELEVLAAIARGGTNVQISGELAISPKTVMHHSASVYRKLGVRGRAEAIAFAFRSGLLTPSPGPS